MYSKYGGNIQKVQIKLYPVCGSMGTKFFSETNSNKELRFIDTKLEFEKDKKRAGYCCKEKPGAINLEKIADYEIPEGSNILKCGVKQCETGYIKDYDGEYCCKGIANSKENIDYVCGLQKTSPKNQEKNYCKSGYFPTTDEEDNNICSRCITTDNVHPKSSRM